MKKHSTSKHLVVVFVILLLLSLPYVFAGKPDKPGTPQEEPVWSVYIPVDADLGLQGTSQVPTETFDGSLCYVFDGSDDDATRNFANVLKRYYQIWSSFNFEILYNSDYTLPVILDGIENESCSDSTCADMFAQITTQQPNGDYSQRIFFAFSSYVDFDYTEQEIGTSVILPDAHFYIDGGTVGSANAFRDYIRGIFNDACCTLTRTDPNTWHIECNMHSISAQQDESDFTTVCKGKNCYPYYYPPETVAEGTADYNKSFDLYFVREPVQ